MTCCYQESIRQYKKALFINGDNAEGWNGLANVYKLSDNKEESIRAYRRALEAEPKNRKTLYSLGIRLALDKQQYAEAARCWNQVRELGPESTKEKEKYQLSYHKLSLDALATYYRRLDDNDREINQIGLHEPMKIRVVFECTKTIQRPEVVVGLHTSDFVHVLSVSNVLPDVRPDFVPGNHEFVCRISDIPLRPASYALRLAFLDQYRQVIWYAENICPVHITQGRYDITKLPQAGLVDVPTQWSFGGSLGNLNSWSQINVRK